MGTITFAETVPLIIGDNKIEITADIEDLKNCSLKIKDGDMSFKMKGTDKAEFKYGNNTFSIGKPSGDFPFPSIGIQHDNKEIILPGKAGKMSSSEKISGLPLTVTLSGSLTREETVINVEKTLPEKKITFKVPDLEAEHPMFKVAGTLDQLLAGILMGGDFKFAQKVTLNFHELTLEQKDGEIKANIKQTVTLDIRPYVTFKDLIKKFKEVTKFIDGAKKDLEKAKEAAKEYRKKYDEQQAAAKKLRILKITLITLTSAAAVAGGIAAVAWWNPGGWVAGAVAAEKAIEISAVTAAIASLGSTVTVFAMSVAAAFVGIGKIFNHWGIAISSQTPEDVDHGVEQLEDLIKTKESELEKLEIYKSKMPKELEGYLVLKPIA